MKSVIKWISVSERLPDEDMHVLFLSGGYVSGPNETKDYRIVDGAYIRGRWRATGDDNTQFIDVTHWAFWPKFPRGATR